METKTYPKKGRPLKGEEKREAVTFRITPKAAASIAEAAKEKGVSQSDIVEELGQQLGHVSK